jgi:hypothetical protein
MIRLCFDSIRMLSGYPINRQHHFHSAPRLARLHPSGILSDTFDSRFSILAPLRRMSFPRLRAERSIRNGNFNAIT